MVAVVLNVVFFVMTLQSITFMFKSFMVAQKLGFTVLGKMFAKLPAAKKTERDTLLGEEEPPTKEGKKEDPIQVKMCKQILKVSRQQARSNQALYDGYMVRDTCPFVKAL